MNKKSMAYPIIFMVIVTAIAVLILAFLNQTTKAKVEANEQLELYKKILYVFDMYDENAEDEEIINLFEEKIEVTKDDKDRKVYTLKDGSEDIAYAVPFDGPGLWGSITGYIGVDSDLETITGVEFISQDETPGLGGRISEPPYKEQYRGIDISDSQDKYIISRPAPGGNIDAIAGATQTSTFVENMINDDLDYFIEGGSN